MTDLFRSLSPYTPVSPEGLGHFDLMIKKYPTGIASSFIHALKPGQTLEFKGPIMKFQYKPNDWPEILMLAGGSGITPMIQVTREIVENPTDMTKVNPDFQQPDLPCTKNDYFSL
jgi:cytochrome-b5 reductase